MCKRFRLYPVLLIPIVVFIYSNLEFHPAFAVPDLYDTDGIEMDRIKLLSPRCRKEVLRVHYEIKANLREVFKGDPELSKEDYDFVTKAHLSTGQDYKGNFNVHFSNAQAQFGSGYDDKEETQLRNIIRISNRLAPYCPEVQMFSFQSAGSWLRWTLRRTKFQKIHGKSSTYPGDYDKYWNWNKLPLDYDPNKDYFPGN